MLADILDCFILYYLFCILEDSPPAAIVAPKPTITEDSGSLDDWEPESEGGITLPCSSHSPHLGLSRPSTQDSIILSTQAIGQVEQNQKTLQNLIDAAEHNWWVTPQGSFRHPFPTIAKGREMAPRYWKVRNPLPNKRITNLYHAPCDPQFSSPGTHSRSRSTHGSWRHFHSSCILIRHILWCYDSYLKSRFGSPFPPEWLP